MFEAYKVGVKLSLNSNVAAGLTALSTHFTKLNRDVEGTHKHLTSLERKLLDIKRIGLVGGVAAGVGGLGLSLFAKPLEAAKEYELAYTRFKTLNLGDAINKQADLFARGTNAFGVSSTQLMDTFRETYGFFGNPEMATVASKKIAELNAANANLFGGKIGSIDGAAAKSLNRFADMRGATNDPQVYFNTLNLAQKMVTGSGGSMKFSDLEQLAKIGGVAFKTQSDEGLLMLSSIIQEQGGARTGNALMSLYQNLVAGRASNKAISAAQDLGLGRLVQQKIGTVGGKDQTRNIFQFTDKGFEAMLQTNTVGAIQQYVLPAIYKKYGSNASDSTIAKAINDILSNRRASDLGVTAATQLTQVLRDKKLVEGAMGVDETIGASKNSTAGRSIELHAKWNSLMTELGTSILPIAVRGLEGLLGIVKGITNFSREFPVLTKGITVAFGALAAVVATGGVLTLATAGFKALGLALGGGGAAGGVGLLGAIAGRAGLIGALTGPLGLVAAIVAVGAAVAGMSWIFDQIKPDRQNDGGDHSGKHWVKGNGRGGAGGHWESNTRAVRRNGVERFIQDDEGYGSWVPVQTVKPGSRASTIQVNTKLHISGREIGQAVTEHQVQEATRPPRGMRIHDSRRHPIPAGN